MKKLPWYKDGLSFKCTGCGACCTGSPGYVWVSEEEMKEMAEFLKISLPEFIKQYTRQVHGRYSLLEDRKTYDCIFLKGKQCTLYNARPKQCRTYPWWPENLESREAWNEEGKRCEGINHPEASLVPFAEIVKEIE